MSKRNAKYARAFDAEREFLRRNADLIAAHQTAAPGDVLLLVDGSAQGRQIVEAIFPGIPLPHMDVHCFNVEPEVFRCLPIYPQINSERGWRTVLVSLRGSLFVSYARPSEALS
jgi:hypothetical protein